MQERGRLHFRWRKQPRWARSSVTCALAVFAAWSCSSIAAAASIGASGHVGIAAQLVNFIRRSPEEVVLLVAVTIIVPLVKRLNVSPILGYLLIGLFLGPSGVNLCQNKSAAHKLAELGIVFFLFEMGLELSVRKVWGMRGDVFGLGLLQYTVTGAIIAAAASVLAPSLPGSALVVLGGALALSSSAFVLQLLRDNEQLGTRHGAASFGVLLLQDIAVVPLLVLIPLLGDTAHLGGAISQALWKATAALAIIGTFGKVCMSQVFSFVKASNSREAFLAVALSTVLLCSRLTSSMGLSDTLGAFVGGVLVAETDYRYQVEADIAPFRGILLGLFFVNVGFSLDLSLVLSEWTTIVPLLLGLLVVKAAVIIIIFSTAGLSYASSVQASAMLAPGGEFAFVLFGLAERLGMLAPRTCSLLVSTTVLSMALTPALAIGGEKLAEGLRKARGQENLEGKDVIASAVISDLERSGQFVVVCGWNAVARAFIELLTADSSVRRYVVFEDNPAMASPLRARGLPVFLADCTRKEVLENFKVRDAELVVIATAPRTDADRKAAAIRRFCKDIPIIVRAEDAEHERYLCGNLGVKAVVPMMVSARFGAACLRELQVSEERIDSLLEEQYRRNFISAKSNDIQEVCGACMATEDPLVEAVEEEKAAALAKDAASERGRLEAQFRLKEPETDADDAADDDDDDSSDEE